jgi:Alkaline and neutral invertase
MDNGIKKTPSSDRMESGMRNTPSSLFSITELDDFYSSHLSRTPRLNIERKISLDDCSISGNLRQVDSHENMSQMDGVGHKAGFDTPRSVSDNVFEPHPTVVAAWEALRKSIVYFRGQPVGTVAACDTATEEALNYDQVWLFAIHFKKKNYNQVYFST